MMKFYLIMIMLIISSMYMNFWLIQNFLIILVFLFMVNYSFSFFSLLSLNFGMDNLSYILILLSLWIGFMMFMASEKIYKMKSFNNMYSFFILLLLLSLLMVFSVMNLFMFYLFFEFSLIPIFVMILGWGYQPERIQAGTYLLFYTLMASLPMLILIFILFSKYKTLDFYFLSFNLNSVIMYLMMNMVFFVKMPMFGVHLWLPKAHVEAPVAGSMILAGIMLKLGSYGIIRLLMMFMKINMKINFLFMNLSLMGAILISVLCIRQSDMKSLIAYSSVVHMGLLLAGLLSMKIYGLKGAILMMIAHGLCSSGLFVLVNINYERFFSRSMYLNKGLINIFPSLSLWWFLLLICNMAAPPSMNLISEIFLINSLLSFSKFFVIFLMLISFFSAVYCLYLYSFTQHGKNFSGMFSFDLISVREFLILFLHWFPLNLMIFKIDLLL